MQAWLLHLPQIEGIKFLNRQIPIGPDIEKEFFLVFIIVQ